MSEEKTEPATVQPGDDVPATEETLTAEQLRELREQAGQAAELRDRLLRTTADFDNFKKRAARERDDVRRAAVEGVIATLLPVLDNFDMALVAASQPGLTVETLKVGVEMIHGQLRQAFADQGLEAIDAFGKPFDPSLHDAVSQVETTEAPEGQVVQQHRKGYRLRDRLVRPASVVVARTPVTPTETTTSSAS